MVETKSRAKRSVNVGLIVRTFIRWPEDKFQLSTDVVLYANMLALQLYVIVLLASCVASSIETLF